MSHFHYHIFICSLLSFIKAVQRFLILRLQPLMLAWRILIFLCEGLPKLAEGVRIISYLTLAFHVNSKDGHYGSDRVNYPVLISFLNRQFFSCNVMLLDKIIQFRQQWDLTMLLWKMMSPPFLKRKGRYIDGIHK